jgi:molecular chaperone HtpG
MASGKINVSVENIFPLIKKIYNDHKFSYANWFLMRPQCAKIKHLTSIGEAKEYNSNYWVKIDKEAKLHIIDQGLE